MKLENIGFYTLSDYRAANTSPTSPLWRCEMLLTEDCNFNCPYCRKLNKGTLTYEQAKATLDLWIEHGLKNVRFSGGEPTLWPDLVKLVRYAKDNNVEHIAISTNGSASLDLYKTLIKAGVNDLSISLDACCSAYGDKMSGIMGAWESVVANIEALAPLCYITLGVVISDQTVGEMVKLIEFADKLGVADIRIISSAQWNGLLKNAKLIPEHILKKYPILDYRVKNVKQDRNVRGLKDTDSRRCYLMMDDVAVNGEYHYPCIIYMREGGKPVGKMDKNFRKDRIKWIENHDCYKDPICRKNCLDVCIDYNNKVLHNKCMSVKCIDQISTDSFDWSAWRSRDLISIVGDVPFRYSNFRSEPLRSRLTSQIVGYCDAKNLVCRPKQNEIAVMCKDGSWFHVRKNEFVELYGSIT